MKETNFLKVKLVDGKIQKTGTDSSFFGNCYNDKDPRRNGLWARWEYKNGQVVAENDRFGYYPLFYYVDDKTFIISNSIIKVLEESGTKELDKDALSVFCRCGFFLGNDTAFEKIKVLPPDATLEWSKGSKLTVKGDIQFTKPQSFTPEEMVDGYISYFRKAVEKILPDDDYFLPLSGGRDSRFILFELLRNKHKPKICVTCGEERDQKVASMIACRLELDHKILKQDHRWVKNTIDKNVRTHFCALEHTWLVEMANYLNENARISYEGTGVGSYSRSIQMLEPKLIEMYHKEQYEDISRLIFNDNGPGEIPLSSMGGKYSFIAENSEKAVYMFAQELKRHREAVNPLASFKFWNWIRRAIALNAFGIQAGVEKNYLPFMDSDLYDFVSSLNPEVALKVEPQKQAILKAFPEYSDIPFCEDLQKISSRKKSSFQKIDNFVRAVLQTSRTDISIVPKLINTKFNPPSGVLSKHLNKFADILIYLAQLENSKKGNGWN